MNFKEKIIGNNMCNMSAGEKSRMMNSMMNMMKNMTSYKTGSEEMDFFKGGFSPMEMCKTMMADMEKPDASNANEPPEVRALFEEWAEQIEDEIFEYIKTCNSSDPEKIAKQFKLSKNSVNYFINRLSKKGKI